MIASNIRVLWDGEADDYSGWVVRYDLDDGQLALESFENLSQTQSDSDEELKKQVGMEMEDLGHTYDAEDVTVERD